MDIISTRMRRLAAGFLAVLSVAVSHAQVTVSEDFKGTSASGWVFGGSPTSTIPYLTAGVVPGDTAGNGWLRLTENTNNQSTFALWDNAIFSVNAQIQIELDYAFYNGSGADGITFFLVDGAVNASTFEPGAFGGSLGYAQKDATAAPPSGVAGMDGGYLGFGLDNFGNFSNPTEGRVGGPGSRPNAVAVRGPESSNFAYIGGATLDAYGQMDFPSSTTRPSQTGVDYRSFRMTLDANNQLTVEMKFGASSSFVTVFTADLSTYDRPETFKIGFTAATGGSTEIHEIRNVAVTMTPWQPTAFEWDNGAGTATWGATPGAANNNWYHADSASNNETPTVNADILFGNKPSTDQTVTLDSANRKVNSITFDAGINYTVNGTGSLLMGDTGVVGLPSINVNDYNGEQAQHHLNLPITLAEALTINNYSFSTLCLNGAITTGGNDIKVHGNGATNFNADINGSGDLIKDGSGIVTINSDNSNGGTPWTGAVTINGGMVVVTTDGALGTTASGTTVNDGGVLAFRAANGNVTYNTTESVTIKGNGIVRGGEGYTGAIYNDGGTNSFAGNITLAANSGVGARDGTLTLSGVISDGASTYSLTKYGDGVVELSNTGNNYNGATIINDGALRISGGENALAGGFSTNGYTGGNLQLAGGVLEINTATTFTRQLGTGSDQVQWTGDGGFSAYGANRTVTLTNSGGTAGGTLTWNAGSFVPTGNALLLSSDYANAMVTLTNAIDFGAASREVRVANGTAGVDATISGVLSNGGLIKTGAGTLDISGANTYTGATEIRGGALRGTINASSNITLNGGVLEITADFTRSLGTGGTNVQWTGDGGFAAYGNNRSVSLNNNSNAVTWASTANFVGNGSKLLLGSSSANRTVTLTNALNLNSAERTILMQNGSATTDAILSGVMSNGSLSVVGDGRLDMTAANTLAGTVTVQGAELRLQGSGTMTSVTGLTVKNGGTFTLDNGSTNNTNRLNNSSTVSLNGGTFSLLGRTGNNDTTETVGALTLAGGASTITVNQGSNNGSAQLTAASLTRNAGATVDFSTSLGTWGSSGDNPRMIFTSAPTPTSGVLGYATVNGGTAFAGYSGGIVAVAGTNTAESSWTTSINATPTSDQMMTAARTVGSLSLGAGIDVNGGGFTLTVDSGGILSTGATTSVISNGTIRAGTGVTDLVAHVYNTSTAGLNISAVIADNSSAKNFVKTGDGVLTLSGSAANTFTGTTYVNAGTLALNKTAGVNAIAGNLTVGDGRGTDILRLDADEQISNTSNLTLRGSDYGAGETILQFNGAGGVGVSETLGTLTIDGVAVIDFAGGNVCDANFLFLDDLLMANSDSILYIRNWVDFTDFLLVKNTANLSAVFNQIRFEGYGDTAYWESYDSTYSRVTPVPEPSTYGAMLMAAALGAFGFKRWRKRRSAA